MPIDFYYIMGSPPCGAVLLTAKVLGVEMNLHTVDLSKGDHLTPEFIKMNPQHTVPTLCDNGFCLWESRAIMTYLASKYGKNDSLYPKDPQKRALVDQRLYFDLGTFYTRLSDHYYQILFYGKPADPAKLAKCQEAFQFLETFLTSTPYVAGNCMTLADLSLAVSVSSYEGVGFDFSSYPKVCAWYAKIKAEAPGYDETNGKFAAAFKQFCDQKK